MIWLAWTIAGLYAVVGLALAYTRRIEQRPPGQRRRRWPYHPPPS